MAPVLDATSSVLFVWVFIFDLRCFPIFSMYRVRKDSKVKTADMKLVQNTKQIPAFFENMFKYNKHLIVSSCLITCVYF